MAPAPIVSFRKLNLATKVLSPNPFSVTQFLYYTVLHSGPPRPGRDRHVRAQAAQRGGPQPVRPRGQEGPGGAGHDWAGVPGDLPCIMVAKLAFIVPNLKKNWHFLRIVGILFVNKNAIKTEKMPLFGPFGTFFSSVNYWLELFGPNLGIFSF